MMKAYTFKIIFVEKKIKFFSSSVISTNRFWFVSLILILRDMQESNPGPLSHQFLVLIMKHPYQENSSKGSIVDSHQIIVIIEFFRCFVGRFFVARYFVSRYFFMRHFVASLADKKHAPNGLHQRGNTVRRMAPESNRKIKSCSASWGTVAQHTARIKLQIKGANIQHRKGTDQYL